MFDTCVENGSERRETDKIETDESLYVYGGNATPAQRHTGYPVSFDSNIVYNIIIIIIIQYIIHILCAVKPYPQYVHDYKIYSHYMYTYRPFALDTCLPMSLAVFFFYILVFSSHIIRDCDCGLLCSQATFFFIPHARFTITALFIVKRNIQHTMIAGCVL